MDFLPSWPFPTNALFIFGVLIIAGLVGGNLAGRTRYIPRITGFIAIGFLLGPSVAGLLAQPILDAAKIFVEVALGLVLFQLGNALDIRIFRDNPGLLISALGESLLSFCFIFPTLLLFGIDPQVAALAAAAGVSASPAVLLLVIRDLRAEGVVSRTALNMVAINNVMAFLLFSLILPFVHHANRAVWGMVLLQPVYQLGGALLLAWVVVKVLMLLARLLGADEREQFPLMVAGVAIAVGAAQILHVSMLMCLLAAGIFLRFSDRRDELKEVRFGKAGDIFFVVMFVTAGANLHLHELSAVGAAALGFVVARYAGKLLFLLLGRRLAGLEWNQAFNLSLALLPMAGLAIGITQVVADFYPELGATLATLVLAAVAILETAGPIATEFALKRCGEVGADHSVEH